MECCLSFADVYRQWQETERGARTRYPCHSGANLASEQLAIDQRWFACFVLQGSALYDALQEVLQSTAQVRARVYEARLAVVRPTPWQNTPCPCP